MSAIGLSARAGRASVDALLGGAGVEIILTLDQEPYLVTKSQLSQAPSLPTRLAAGDTDWALRGSSA